ncbi:hypothetical protein CAC42_6404 [Sphaceloma murrayae]|uniref:Beta-glucuronidase C-terminal domain-containing protein n=1 Tax=Sphaceloma murrayae TaxID=2082308 RepID=A0A2K1QMB3_9PEZI|nr:hypothetical protein CAC42_6404 [Sphaceloma murrayae]
MAEMAFDLGFFDVLAAARKSTSSPSQSAYTLEFVQAPGLPTLANVMVFIPRRRPIQSNEEKPLCLLIWTWTWNWTWTPTLIMVSSSLLLLLLGVLDSGLAADARSVTIPKTAPKGAGQPWADFVSYSIELSSIVDYAGNLSAPNTYSLNLLKNLEALTGTKPSIRVGGATQDRTVFVPTQEAAYIGTIIPAISPDFPGRVTIGPKFFESYQTWPGFQFTHGLNYANLGALNATIASIPYACKALRSNLIAFEFGNEPDLFVLFRVRNATTWTDKAYVDEWLSSVSSVRKAALQACASQIPEYDFPLYGPTFAGLERGDLGNLTVLDPKTSWSLGLSTSPITQLVTHNYMGAASSPGLSLQGTLMNNTAIRTRVQAHLAFYKAISTTRPLILGEHNSIAQQGRPGLSDAFGAALWGLTFNTMAAARGFKRQHMHQGTNYRYQMWQPVDTNFSARATKPAYYGNVALAAFLGGFEGEGRVAELDLRVDTGAAFAIWRGGKVRRVLVVDLRVYNGTAATGTRPSGTYKLDFAGKCEGGKVRRLMAAGSDATTGVTWDGTTYDFKNMGKPARAAKKTVEKVKVGRNGKMSIEVPWSSAAVIDC